MKKVDWLCLSLILTGMTMSDISWSYSHGRNNYSGYSHGNRGYSQRHYSRKPNFSMGIGVASSFGSYSRFGYSGRNTRIYGGFAYGRHYPRYRQPYYRPYYRPYGYLDNRFYWPAYPPVAYPPVIVVPPDPPVYIQQQPVRPAPLPPPESAATNYWYYCENPAGYYPEVERCPGEWIKVPPRPAQ